MDRGDEPSRRATRNQTENKLPLGTHAKEVVVKSAVLKISHPQREEMTLTNLSCIFVVTRPLDKHQQFVPRRLETFG